MAKLTSDDIQPTCELLEKLQNVQRAIRDLTDAHDDGSPGDFKVAITQDCGGKDTPVAHTHRLSWWVVQRGLRAMERELMSKLQAKDIEVEAYAPQEAS
jgi:hypothetical protein